MHRSMRRRIVCLEKTFATSKAAHCFERYELFLLLYEDMSQRGMFAAIPECPSALAYFRETIVRARAYVTPDHVKNLEQPNRIRRQQVAHDFPEVRRAWQRLDELTKSVLPNTPPPTEEEIESLMRKISRMSAECRQQQAAAHDCD